MERADVRLRLPALALASSLAAATAFAWDALCDLRPAVGEVDVGVASEVRAEAPAPARLPGLVGFALRRGTAATTPPPGRVPRSGDWRPVRVDVLDAETGRPLREATWELAGSRVEESLAAGEWHRLPRGDVEGGAPRAHAHAGYVGWDEGVSIRSAYGARRFRAVVPLRREARVEVETFGPPETREGGRVDSAQVAGRAVPVDSVDVGPGSFTLRGVPFLRGEPLAISFRRPDAPPVEWLGFLPEDSRDDVRARIRGPEAAAGAAPTVPEGPCGQALG
jgi:hypothetical protein